MSNSVRRFLASPLVLFDTTRNFMQSNPKTANYTMMWTSFGVLLLIGNGAEKLTVRGGVKSQYERYRMANRFFIPYWMADYNFRFPQIKQ